MLLTYYRTIKRLKYLQISNRISRKFPKISRPLKFVLMPFPAGIASFLSNKITYMDKKLIFIGMEGSIRAYKDLPILWQYNLFYCDFLMSDCISHHDKLSLILEINDLLKNKSSIGRDPYPTSLRMVNLMKWISTLHKGLIDKEILKLINSDYQRLHNEIEYHLLGNHLLANLKALIFHDVFFDHKKKDSYLKKWIQDYELQIKEQVLEDGGHFELSHMYQNIIIEDIADIFNILDHRKLFKKNLSKILIKMIRWSNLLTNSNEELFYVNDTVNGISKSTFKLNEYISQILKKNKMNFFFEGEKVITTLKESGFSNIRSKSFFLNINHSNLKATYIPGHFHADTFSFEISNSKGKIICNPGLSTYTESNERLEERGTLSHNCLSIDSENSSEIWKSFRLGRAAEVISFQSNTINSQSIISATHNGFKDAIHKRTWNIADDLIEIYDDVTSLQSQIISINFLLHPSFKIIATQGTEFLIQDNTSKYLIKLYASQDTEIIVKDAYYCNSFGIKIDSSSLLLSSKKTDKIETLSSKFTIAKI